VLGLGSSFFPGGVAVKYRVLAADPPWLHGDQLPGNGRGAGKHYDLLTVEQICQFPIPPMEDDALLFLWRVSSMPEEACRVVRAWGFVPKSELIWRKLTKNGKLHFGMGRYVRLGHEGCIIAARGRGASLIKDHSVRSMFETGDGSIEFEAQVGRHSEKPAEFFDIVEQLADGPYVELFARRQRSLWTCLGNEMPRTKLPALRLG